MSSGYHRESTEVDAHYPVSGCPKYMRLPHVPVFDFVLGPTWQRQGCNEVMHVRPTPAAAKYLTLVSRLVVGSSSYTC